jgi:hypothetical protein
MTPKNLNRYNSTLSKVKEFYNSYKSQKTFVSISYKVFCCKKWRIQWFLSKKCGKPAVFAQFFCIFWAAWGLIRLS